MLDKVGNEIPYRLEMAFKRKGLAPTIAEYDALSKFVIEMIESKDQPFIGINKPTFEAICSDMQNILKAEVPYAVCPFCNGDGCKACLGRGWLGKFRYDATASARQ